VEVYDPVADTWIAKNPLPAERTSSGAAVINGTLYLPGGELNDDFFGPHLDPTTLAYDPLTDAWTTRASMATPRGGYAAAALNGLIYAIGGVSDAVEAYDPAADSWSAKAPFPTPLYWSPAAA